MIESARAMSDDGFSARADCRCSLCQSYIAGGADGSGPQFITRQAASTGDYRVDALVYPDLDRWNSVAAVGTPAPVTYSFLSAANSSGDSFGFAPVNGTQIEGARAAFAAWESATNVKFVEVSSGGDIAIGTNDQTDSSAYAYSPGTTYGGDIYLSNAVSSNLDMSAGGFGFLTFIHEIGHAIGLKHPGSYNGSSNSGDPPYLSAAED
ncbi:MAG: matrixin family metalloprotease, partial [Alphaproteobacteria bacterium]|nr:matrixin family metalloprotease [Alphaproteobacteria bacterium]